MNHKNSVKISWFLFINLCLLQSGIAARNIGKVSGASQPAVIAIIDTTSGKDDMANLISLLTVELSQQPNVNLVERQEVDKVK